MTGAWLQEILNSFLASDDVFRLNFFQAVVFLSPRPDEVNIHEDAKELLLGYSTVYYEFYPSSVGIEQGVFLLSEGTLASVYRLYNDTHRAFLHSMVAHERRYNYLPRECPHYWTDRYSGFYRLATTGERLESVAIAVPSRISSVRTPEYPLAGIRIAVKDIFEVQNIRISVCNKAYYELHDPPKKTAACIELLQEAGAVIVGTTKLASFAATEEPVECIDYQAP